MNKIHYMKFLKINLNTVFHKNKENRNPYIIHNTEIFHGLKSGLNVA